MSLQSQYEREEEAIQEPLAPLRAYRLKCLVCDALRTLAVRHPIPHAFTLDCATYGPSGPREDQP